MSFDNYYYIYLVYSFICYDKKFYLSLINLYFNLSNLLKISNLLTYDYYDDFINILLSNKKINTSYKNQSIYQN